jgi:dipeptidyl aminopeptidase/acylaminoacyl peptidase
MYTALKLLGVPTAFVMVEGENHGIMDFNKRQQWINTMLAWFNRWLQDDPSWWEAIYTPKEL